MFIYLNSKSNLTISSGNTTDWYEFKKKNLRKINNK